MKKTKLLKEFVMALTEGTISEFAEKYKLTPDDVSKWSLSVYYSQIADEVLDLIYVKKESDTKKTYGQINNESYYKNFRDGMEDVRWSDLTENEKVALDASAEAVIEAYKKDRKKAKKTI